MNPKEQTLKLVAKCNALATDYHFIEQGTFGFTCQCGFHTGFGGDALAHMQEVTS